MIVSWVSERKSFFQKKQTGRTNQFSNSEPPTSANFLAEIIENVQLLCATHIPCERLTGSSENPVFIKPKDSNQFIPLTLDQFALWAQTMVYFLSLIQT
ncbi:hypothetical protein VP01_1818g1 [Puccinia sorghi]|uniref:Uncharacterized protein n=1 Tax=Puccinia sorghi TaxID=27349 RepID=A0A0L6VEM6_9BASI|nr:hypothetical protein VP01_1818g1 [Puccinia sorghi]